ncbi:MAG: hypothetical protein E7J45_00180 [Veillonella sp.]|uniref:XkdQ/YqbQ family protein n=1 Tax=Veillonella sp. TaxID=1926307 RepID=UPI00257F3541|nr:hypothetical protein [Veillonella sp.]MBS6862527.1 hypothetical protein [Veillonella sp.]MDU7877107.1 hypothetical protein [Veillonella sp.]
MEEFNSVEITNAPLNLTYELTVRNQKDMLLIEPQDGVTLDRSPDLAPAKLTFNVLKDPLLDIQEGDLVNFKVNGELIFVGYIFEKSRSKNNIIQVTCYDQCRYLKSEGYYIFDGKNSASELIIALSKDLGIKLGEIAPTEYKISRVFDGKSYQDILLTMLKLTSINSPKIPVKALNAKKTKTLNPDKYRGGYSGLDNVRMDKDSHAERTLNPEKADHTFDEISTDVKRKPIYVAYDDKGLLTVKELNDMVTDILIDASQVEDYEYISSIDRNTFTQILVVREAKTGSDKHKEAYRTGGAYASEETKRWGVLQKVYKPDEKDLNAIEKAKTMLDNLARKTHTLRLKGCLGRTIIRPGSGIWLNFDIGDQILNELVYVQAVTHNFSNNKHTMDLDIIYFDKQEPVITTIDRGDEEIRKRLANSKKGKSGKGGTTSVNKGSANASAVQTGLTSIEGTSSPYSTEGCVDRATLAGSYYNTDLYDARAKGIVNTDELETHLNSRGYSSDAYTGSANAGDLLFYGDNNHVVVSDGMGGCYGNSSDKGYVIHYPDVNYAFRNGEAPNKIIRTGV